MARIALVGGHGKVALLAEPLLVRAGHQVDALIRNADHAADVSATGAAPVVADVQTLGAEALTELLRGHDVVLWSAGAGGGDPRRTYAVDRDAAIRSMDAAVAAGVERFVMVSYFGAGPDHGVPQDAPFFPYADAKTAADERLQTSALDWTVLRPSTLTDDDGTGSIELDGPGVEPGQVPRADVAAVIAEVVGRTDLAGRTIAFNGGDTPISEALDRVAGG